METPTQQRTRVLVCRSNICNWVSRRSSFGHPSCFDRAAVEPGGSQFRPPAKRLRSADLNFEMCFFFKL